MKAAYINAVQAIRSVPTIMQVVAETTGLRFVCVAHVTGDSWLTCSVLDQLGFGLKPGDELDVSTTICRDVQRHQATIVIDHVSEDPLFHEHPTPKMYGFESYFSTPVYDSDGAFFGTLCGLDPLPANLSQPKTLETLKLFAELISSQLTIEKKLRQAESSLRIERETAQLREQFIAILGHDVRTPLSSILSGLEILKMLKPGEQALKVIERIERSGGRIAGLVDDVMDFTRGRMGGGLPVTLGASTDLERHLRHALAELESAHPGAVIEADIGFDCAVWCDQERLVQLLSNLVVNALVHGDRSQPVRVQVHCHAGRLSMAVANAGTPIPEEKMAQLFQPFWRGAGEGGTDGLGLGLYIAAEIAKSHGGSLTATSSAQETRFVFSQDSAA